MLFFIPVTSEITAEIMAETTIKPIEVTDETTSIPEILTTTSSEDSVTEMISSTISSTTTTSSTTEEPMIEDNILDDDTDYDDQEEDEVLEVGDDEPVEDDDAPDVHTLKCLPGSPEADSGLMTMSCKEQEDRDPITVLISAEGLDLDTLARKKFKIVVKDYMLMEMQQRPVSLKPRRRR